jgi:hypothetical protein
MDHTMNKHYIFAFKILNSKFEFKYKLGIAQYTSIPLKLTFINPYCLKLQYLITD